MAVDAAAAERNIYTVTWVRLVSLFCLTIHRCTVFIATDSSFETPETSRISALTITNQITLTTPTQLSKWRPQTTTKCGRSATSSHYGSSSSSSWESTSSSPSSACPRRKTWTTTSTVPVTIALSTQIRLCMYIRFSSLRHRDSSPAFKL